MSGQGITTGLPYVDFTNPYTANYFKVAPSLTPAAKASLTGVDTSALEAALFGKDIPLFVGGEALMGCRIIEGPFLEETGSPTSQTVSFIATPGMVATPSATRTFPSLRLNGTESWTLAGGPIGSPFAGITVNTNMGSETQTPFASSIARFGDHAVAYRSMICVELQNVPLSVFNNVIPFVSIFVHEADSITRNDALTALARYARYDDSEFEFDVSGTDTFWIVGQDSQFIPLLTDLRRIFRNWNITTSDKLRVIENSIADGEDFSLTRATALINSMGWTSQSPLSIPAQRLLGFIDTGRDNDFNTATGELERFPIALTASQNSETIELPIGMGLAAADILVNDSLEIDDIARKKMRATVKTDLYGVGAGDIGNFSDDDDITFNGRVTSRVTRAADHAVEIELEQIA